MHGYPSAKLVLRVMSCRYFLKAAGILNSSSFKTFNLATTATALEPLAWDRPNAFKSNGSSLTLSKPRGSVQK
eukprot:5122470-Amphidinium_carterae.1